jgi:ligand-binding sensor domain-containing protein/two-component sensor histidine kinase
MSGLSAARLNPRAVSRSTAPLSNAQVVLACVLVLIVVSSATAERLPIHTYTTEDGLAHANVRRIVRDPRGFLWFCTIDGLSRFDGAEFVTYRTSDGLPDPWVTDLLTTRDGMYWVATNGGVATFEPLTRHLPQDGQHQAAQGAGRSFSSVAFDGSSLHRQVRVLLEDRAGRVWAGGAGGLSVLDRRVSPASFRPVVPSPGAMVTSLIESADGSLWIGTLGGLFHRRLSGEVSPEPIALRGGVTHVRALAQDKDGRLWVGHDEGLLVLGPGAGVSRPASSAARELRGCGAGPLPHRRLHFPTRADDACIMSPSDGLVDRRVYALMVGSDGHIRVGTVSGLSDIDGAHVTSVSHAHGLVDDPISTITEDRDGNLWIGTDASGALRIAAFGLVSYFEADGLRNDFVPSLFEDEPGRVVAVSLSRFTINEFDGRRFVKIRFNVPRRVPDTRYFTVLRDHLGAWWLGTPMGLYRFPPTGRIAHLARVTPDAHYARLAAVPSDDLYPLFEDRRGDIWLIAQLPDQARLVRWRRASDDFTPYGASEGLGAISSEWRFSRPAIVESPTGQLFFGFRDVGLFEYRDGRFEAIRDRGQPLHVASLHIDRRGRLWIVGVDGSVRRRENPSTRRLISDTTVARSLMGANVRCMVEDASGHFYFGTTSGIIEVDPKTGDTRRYTTADGLAQNEVWSALASHGGDIWFGTIAGVSRLDAARVRPRPRAPQALITTVRVNGEARLVSELGDKEISGLTLAPSERGIAIDFFALAFGSAEDLRYQYRLEGTEDAWSPPTPVRSVNYAHLSPGAYRFQVRAVTLSGATSALPASVSFHILPPVWQRSWFVAVVSAVVVGLVVLLYRYRVAQLVAIERVRTRIATDLHDDIGASLSQIAIQSELALGEADVSPGTANALGRIATTSRELVESMGDIVWAINPARDRVGDLLQRMRYFASDTLTGKNIEFSFNAPETGRDLALATEVRREVLLIFKEAVNNIARHARCSRADIDVRIERGGLFVQVADDGQGLESVARGNGHGLASIQARARRLNGRLEITTSAGGGTRLALHVPWRRPSHAYLSR